MHHKCDFYYKKIKKDASFWKTLLAQCTSHSSP